MLKVRIETKNVAFEDDLLIYQIRLCLADVKDQLEEGNREGNIHDTNGNLVGSFKLTNR